MRLHLLSTKQRVDSAALNSLDCGRRLSKLQSRNYVQGWITQERSGQRRHNKNTMSVAGKIQEVFDHQRPRHKSLKTHKKRLLSPLNAFKVAYSNGTWALHSEQPAAVCGLPDGEEQSVRKGPSPHTLMGE